ncbi:MAG: NTP transferase domain-containing protein [Kordiimonas sp.]
METIGVIVAGGKSSRIGRDKALLKHGTITLLQHAQNLLDDLGIDNRFILGRPDTQDGVPDPYPGEGPARNLQGWFDLQKPPFQVLVLPVDMPFLTTEPLEHLLSQPTGAYFDDLYLPFTATIRESKNTSTARMKDLLPQLGVTCVQPHKNWMQQLVNINQIADLTLLDSKN